MVNTLSDFFLPLLAVRLKMAAMRGQLVVIRDVNGCALVRRVWEFSPLGVYIMSEDQWKLRTSGGKSLEPVGFPIGDVFMYDDAAKGELASGGLDWSALTPFA